MAEIPEPLPAGPHVDLKTGNLSTALKDWLERNISQTVASTVIQIGGVISGVTQNAAQLAQERADRIANDAAVQVAASGGSGSTSNASTFSNGVSSGATWVTICTVPLTPTGAGGDYSITVYTDALISGGLSDDGTVATSFAGNWRIREELSGGGTEYTLDSGTFTVDYTPPQTYSEAGIPFDVPAFWSVTFTGLPLTAVLIPANEGAAVDIRLEIQRASGTNEITAPGLSGSMSVVWTA